MGREGNGCRADHRRRLLVILALLFVALPLARAQVPSVSLGLESSDDPQDVAVVLQILFLLTILSLAPAILMLTTCFTRVVIVLSFLRRALGTNQTPSNQIIVGLSLFLTFFIMAPTWQQVYDEAIRPYMNEEIDPLERTVLRDGEEKTETVAPFQQAVERALVPVRNFMFMQLGERGEENVIMFLSMAGQEPQVETLDEIPTYVLVPAFVVAELHRAFIIGFLLFLPFMVIDLVTSSILMSMGMIMLPPVLISLPFKLLLFVLVDGWTLLIDNIARGFM